MAAADVIAELPVFEAEGDVAALRQLAQESLLPNAAASRPDDRRPSRRHEGTGLLRAHLGAVLGSAVSERQREERPAGQAEGSGDGGKVVSWKAASRSAKLRQLTDVEKRGARAAIFLDLLDFAKGLGGASSHLEARMDKALEAMVAQEARAEEARRATQATEPSEPWEDRTAAALEERLQKALLAAFRRRGQAARRPREVAGPAPRSEEKAVDAPEETAPAPHSEEEEKEEEKKKEEGGEEVASQPEEEEAQVVGPVPRSEDEKAAVPPEETAPAPDSEAKEEGGGEEVVSQPEEEEAPPSDAIDEAKAADGPPGQAARKLSCGGC